MSISIEEEQISLVDLEVKKEKENFIVENLNTGDFYEMNEVCIKAIHLMQDSIAFEEIEMVLKEMYPHEEVDINGFVNQLLEFGLIQYSGQDDKEYTTHKKSFINKIPIHIGKIAFNKISLSIYSFLFVITLFNLLFNNKTHPQYTDFFIFEMMTFNLLAWLIVSLIIILIHEFGHILAARSYGLPIELGIGSRLLFVVFETDLKYIWRLKKNERNVIYLAGIFFDNIVLFLSIIGQFIFVENSFMFLLCKLITVQTLINIIYQFGIFMKTDLYYFLENLTGYYNLQEMAINQLKTFFVNRVNKDIKKGQAIWQLIYGFVYLIGSVSVLSVVLFLSVPQMFYAFVSSIHKVVNSPNTLSFWDGAIFITQSVLMISLLIFSWYKKLKTIKSGDSFE
jgi:putative peptide zinc metalloprotease protein